MSFKFRIFALIFLLIAVSAGISINVITVSFTESDHLRQALSYDAINQRLKYTFTVINDFPGSAGKDLLFLETLSSVKNINVLQSDSALDAAYADFQNFLKRNEAYKELYFFHKNSGCMMRINNESMREYMPGMAGMNNAENRCNAVSSAIYRVIGKASLLSPGEIYISPLTFYEGTPVIFYAAPIDAESDIVSVIDADYFLEEIRRLARDGETVFLLDRNGSYLAHPDQSKEKLAGGKDNFYRDFPVIPSNALSDINMQRFESEREIFNFWRIYPTQSNFALYRGANKIKDSESSDSYWVMAAVSKKPLENSWWQNSSRLTAVAAVVLIHFFIIMLSYFVVDYLQIQSAKLFSIQKSKR